MLCDDSQPSGKSPRPGKGGPALPFSWYLAIPPWLPGGKILAMPYHLSCGSSSLKGIALYIKIGELISRTISHFGSSLFQDLVTPQRFALCVMARESEIVQV